MRFLDYFFRKLDTSPFVLGNNIDVTRHHETSATEKLGASKVSIIIPTRDKPTLLKACIGSIERTTVGLNIEIIVVDNNSVQRETIDYLQTLKTGGHKVLSYQQKFNFSEICNFAAEEATGEFLCFLNNDIEALEPGWLSYMVEHAMQPSVGLVGAILKFPSGAIQHMGIALGYTGVAGHPGRGENPEHLIPINCYRVSAVTFACAVTSLSKFKSLRGLDPNFPVGFNDVDISIRSLGQNLENVVCTHAHLLHRESQSRGRTLSLGGFNQAVEDVLRLLKKHGSLLREDFFVRGVLSDKTGK
jgi:GT2 family glycosyltransferase